jgi:hypothetical protein
MRHCANVADQFAQTLSQASFTGNSLHSLVPLDMVQVGNGHKRQGTEEDDIEGPTKKRRVSTKKLKDPDAPKRAASSYIFFQNDLRQELRKQHPGISSADIMTRVSKQWAEMTREQKAVSLQLEFCPQFALTQSLSLTSAFKPRLNRSGRQRNEPTKSVGVSWQQPNVPVTRWRLPLWKNLCTEMVHLSVLFLCKLGVSSY